tara:strand:- start:837 stop:1685 length:849 start_codon:yes stop_codon:yes gene_type:complete
MATGRDDFVIAVRSAFLKKGAQQRFSLVALIFFSIILILLTKFNFIGINYLKIGLNEIIYRTAFIISLPEKQFSKANKVIQDHFSTYSNYKKTLSELNELKAKKYKEDFIIEENRRLRKLIDENINSSNEQIAKVLLDKNSPFLRSIILNKGSQNNVLMGMAVLSDEYLVGKIVEVNYSTSRALLLSDLNSKIPVSIFPGNHQSILSGTGKNFGELQYIKDKIDLNLDSVVYTSGAGGIFKSGIPVGKINLSEGTGGQFVTFFTDLSQLDFVKIVSYEKGDD